MTYLLATIGGVIIGTIVTLIFQRMLFTFGTLKIDRSDPEKEKYRLCIDNLDKLAKKKRITFKIDNHADLSQE